MNSSASRSIFGALFRPALLALLALVASVAPLRAITIVVARQHLASGDFVQMNTALAAYLKANPSSQEGLALRAIARAGLAAETTVPVLLRKAFGAERAVIDFGTGEFDVFFPTTKFSFAPALRFGTSGTAPVTYTYTGARQESDLSIATIPAMSFQNNSGDEYRLVLRFNLAPGAPTQSGTYLRVNDVLFATGAARIFNGSLNVDEFNPAPPQIVSQGPAQDEASVLIPPGGVLDMYVLGSTGGDQRITPVGPLPPSLTVRNGQVVYAIAERTPRPAVLSDALAPASVLNSSVGADLATLQPDFQLLLSPEETGSVTTTVLAYPDAQLLLAEIKFLEALRNLSLSYNLNFKFKLSTLLDTDTLTFLADNPTFFTPKPDNGGLAKSRARSLALLIEATTHYETASDAGIWTRPAPTSGAFLFTLDPELDAFAEKLRFDTAFAQLRAALSGPVPLADLSSDLAENSDLPAVASADLRPLFGKPTVNLRAGLPQFSADRQLVRGSSSGLLNTGLLPGLDSLGWENFIAGQNLADESQTSGAGALKIQRQSTDTSVAEGEVGLLSVFAEFTPAPRYQWQRLQGKDYEDINDLPGATSPTLRFPSAARAQSGTYRARVTDIRTVGAIPLFSKPIKLTVTYLPEISVHPQGGTFAPKQSTTLSVAAKGVPETLRYLWRKNGQPIAKATKATYKIVIGPDSGGTYDVLVTNTRGSVASLPAVINVTPTVALTSAAAARRTAHAGSTLSLSYVVGGTGPFTYAWRRQNFPVQNPPVVVPVGDQATLILDNLTAAQAGLYTLQVTTPFGTATSPATEVWVDTPPASLPIGTTVAFTDEGGASTTLTVGPSALRFTDGSTFTYKLYSSTTRSNGVLNGATLVRKAGTLTYTYQLEFTTARNATYLRLSPVPGAPGTAVVTPPAAL